MTTRSLLLFLLLTPAIANADRPSAWLFRATPGYAYAWDSASRCSIDGHVMVGGWQIGKFVTPSLMVGGSLGIGAHLPAECNADDERASFPMSMTAGPVLNWYPMRNGLHVIASAGFAAVDSGASMPVTDVGIGASIAIGYDTHWFDFKSGEEARAGLLFQISAMRTTADHATLMPALLFTTCVD